MYVLGRVIEMNSAIIENPESIILARVIGSTESTLPPAVAQEFLRWCFADADQQRMSQLAAKARAGSLTPEESMEAESYERVSSFLGLIKSKARRSLQGSSNT